MENTVCSVQKTCFVKVKPNKFSMSVTVSAEDLEKEDSLKKLNNYKGKFNDTFAKFKDSVYDKAESYDTYDTGNYRGDQKFVSECRISFSCDKVDLAKEMFDTFMKVKHVDVSPPRFSVKNVAHHEQSLLKTAFEKCVEQAKMECDVVGVDFNDLKIAAWNNSFRYSEDTQVNSPIRAMAASSFEAVSANKNTNNLNFEVQETNVSLSLTVSFAFKK